MIVNSNCDEQSAGREPVASWARSYLARGPCQTLVVNVKLNFFFAIQTQSRKSLSLDEFEFGSLPDASFLTARSVCKSCGLLACQTEASTQHYSSPRQLREFEFAVK